MSRLTLATSLLNGFLAVSEFSTTPTQAATVNRLQVTCSHVMTNGRSSAPYVRVQVVLGSDLDIVLATRVVPTSRGQYKATLSYPRQVNNTVLTVSIGNWDGTQYINPATLYSRNCSHGTVPSATPTFVPTQIPYSTVDTAVVTCATTELSGRTDASFVRVQVGLAPNLSVVLDDAIVPSTHGRYAVALHYPQQLNTTLLMISIGGWNGSKYTHPATIFSRNCADGS